jgi:hypothetical protein
MDMTKKAQVLKPDPNFKWPEKASARLRMAVDDAIAAKRAGHGLDMRSWFDIDPRGIRCTVCLAGAVMLHVFGTPPPPDPRANVYTERRDSLDPADLDDRDHEYLIQIDEIRRGHFYMYEGWPGQQLTELYDALGLDEHATTIPALKKFYKLADYMEELGL